MHKISKANNSGNYRIHGNRSQVSAYVVTPHVVLVAFEAQVVAEAPKLGMMIGAGEMSPGGAARARGAVRPLRCQRRVI